MSEQWVSRAELLTRVTFPLLLWSNHCMYYVDQEKDFLWDLKRNFDLGTYEKVNIIDSQGICYQSTEAKLGQVRFKNVWDILGIYHKKWWPHTIELKLSNVRKKRFSDFKKEAIDFVTKDKWYRRPNQGLSLNEQYKSVKIASKAHTFPELFAALGSMMSLKYRRALFDE